MKPNLVSNPAPSQPSRRPILLPAVIAFGLGVALAGVWFQSHRFVPQSEGLSDSTTDLLAHLAAPVTIRYYSLLPSGSADETLQAFARRVDQLLNKMQAASGGKIQFSSIDQPADTNSTAASADGLQAFNLDKGDACFLGLTIVSGQNKETLARLQPEWESALQYDLARAILRVAASAAPPPLAPEIAKPSPEIIASLNRLIPDVSAVTSEQANQIIHADFVKRIGEVGAETEAQIQAAQQQLAAAQNSGSPADQAAAQKTMLQVQLAQGEKYKELAAQLQLQLAVFQQMKNGTGNAAK